MNKQTDQRGGYTHRDSKPRDQRNRSEYTYRDSKPRDQRSESYTFRAAFRIGKVS